MTPTFYLIEHINELFLFTVHCKLGPWIKSPCSSTCGVNVTRTLTRQVIQQSKNGGMPCTGELKKTENCKFSPCPSKFNDHNFQS